MFALKIVNKKKQKLWPSRIYFEGVQIIVELIEANTIRTFASNTKPARNFKLFQNFIIEDRPKITGSMDEIVI